MPTDRVLYSLHFGKIPGVSGGPTNFGLDPYVATRGANGWTTRYVGLPADETPGGETVRLAALRLGRRSRRLRLRRNRPLLALLPGWLDRHPGPHAGRRPGAGHDGIARPRPGRNPAGFIGQPLSGDGTHLVFGSTSKFEDGATAGDVTIYDRDLATGTTHVVSTHARRGDDDRYRQRRARRSPPTARGSCSASSSPPIAFGNQLLAPLHERRRLQLDDRPDADHHHGRPLQRHDRRRLERLLHHRGQARRRRHRHQRRPLPGRRRRREAPP